MTTTISQEKLLAALRRTCERTPRMSDWRKLADGRIVRFIAWNRAARRAR